MYTENNPRKIPVSRLYLRVRYNGIACGIIVHRYRSSGIPSLFFFFPVLVLVNVVEIVPMRADVRGVGGIARFREGSLFATPLLSNHPIRTNSEANQHSYPWLE